MRTIGLTIPKVATPAKGQPPKEVPKKGNSKEK